MYQNLLNDSILITDSAGLANTINVIYSTTDDVLRALNNNPSNNDAIVLEVDKTKDQIVTFDFELITPDAGAYVDVLTSSGASMPSGTVTLTGALGTPICGAPSTPTASRFVGKVLVPRKKDNPDPVSYVVFRLANLAGTGPVADAFHGSIRLYTEEVQAFQPSK